MQSTNIAQPEFQFDSDDPEGFRAGMYRFGRELGAQQTGMSVYDIPPGQAICPYHYEYGEEEWLLVLGGRPTVRLAEGPQQLVPFDVVFFPLGPDGAHQVRNDSDANARVVMWSTVVHPTATAYPDSDKVAIWTGVKGEDVMATRSSNVEYFHGETG
jgi:uncharacterized cupin superfamily protein